MKNVISTPRAPRPSGAYSQAVVAGNVIYVAGQVARDPTTQAFIGGSVSAQTARVLDNITAILEAAGANRAAVVRTNVYLADIDTFEEMNEMYAQYFPIAPPARTTVQARLGGKAAVEIDVIAVLA